MLKKYNQIISSYTPSEFIPAEFLANPHYQTIVGSEAIRSKLFGYSRTFDCDRKRFDTPDGDFFYADFTQENIESSALVIVLHGLESDANSPLVTKMATAFHSKGFQCCLMVFRGCSGEDNLRPGAYHVGFTKDLNQLSQYIKDTFPGKRIYLSGFSLGGNVCLKFLGELSDTAQDRNICGAAVTCVPFDPVASHYKLDAPGTMIILLASLPRQMAHILHLLFFFF